MANSRLREAIRWRRWGKRDWAIAAVAFATVSFALILQFDSPSSSSSWSNQSSPNSAETLLVDLTLLSNAKDRGAVCLDGSLPGYHFQKGFGSGSSNWLLHIEGGGWCNTIESCSKRKITALGSSNFMDHRVPFSGILSHKASENPEFFNWNKVKIRYCDGASLSGNRGSEVQDGRKLFFRGQLIWEAVMDELMSAGMANAKQALLSGCSAGGLATLIHCDDFRVKLPKASNVKCLADAGFFLDEKDISGNYTMRSFNHEVVNLQGVAQSLNKDCVSRMEPSQCFFPQEILKHVQTPVFLVNPAYDFWQIQNILAPVASDPRQYWRNCKLSIKNCNQSQIDALHEFRNSMLKALSEFQQKEDSGIYINSCFSHCQTWMASTWHSSNSPRVNNKTIAEAVGDWFFSRKTAKEVDCTYPCNPTCYNMNFGS
ncbi:hypothetical protein Sjap_001769 [Stephania japonica]|uniref:Pectin acetylesterase n=1 Tax=Stephania japonica TaxID=461633 RepID=A0AAP0KMW6_9MAGN